MDGLRALIAETNKSASATVKATGEALENVLVAMADERAVAAAQDDPLARVTIWEPLTRLYDALRTEVAERVGSGATGRIGEARAREAAAAIATFDTMTEEPFLEGPRALQEYWCAKTLAAGTGFRVEKAPVLRWFKKAIKSSHADRINKFVAENANWYAKEATLTDDARAVIGRIGQALGPLLGVWTAVVRPAAKGEQSVWSVLDAQMVLRCLVLAVWQDATAATSWMYEGPASVATRETTAGLVAEWTRALMVHVKQQFVRYSESQIRQTLQQRAEVERTAVVNEILGQADDDLRAAEFLKKTFRIGRWALGQNLRAYNADLLDAEVEQRRAQGIVETAIDPVLLESQLLAATMAATVEDGYDVDQGAAGDDY
jgi:hypothetical protein